MALGWLGQADPLPDGVVFVLIGGAVAVILIVGAALRRDQRNRGTLREREGRQEELQRAQGVVDAKRKERDDRLYEQHVALNDLTARKVELESRLLQAQLNNADRDKAARDQHDEYNRLMVRKLQLEIDSLKLHIREQRKRNEDFTSYDDE